MITTVLLVLLLSALSCESSASQDSETWSVAPVEGEWIVAFKDYYELEQRKKLLQDIMGDVSGWREKPRANVAYGMPSDFSLIRVERGKRDFVLLRLRSHPKIKSVTPQLEVVGSLLSSSSTGSEDESSDGGGVVVPLKLGAQSVWAEGFTGKGVKVAVFDTGLARAVYHIHNVVERRDWTNENTVEDGVGHGTFVAGMIAGTNPACMGMAPDCDVHVFRVFTSRRVSFTAWFLDAFNYAIHSKVQVLNLSIGGPDFMDRPFTEKVNEATSNGIIMVSAIGNDGPLFGTLNNPADMNDVIGVGGLGRADKVASFSSRGMTTWELPFGFGRVKPDVLTFANQLKGLDRSGGCMIQSGTSMASPALAGAVTLMLSAVPPERKHLLNPASVKQVLLQTAARLDKAGIFEQGMGRLNLVAAVKAIRAYEPHLSFHPPYFDLTDCPYFSPFCDQPIYYSSMPLILNATLLNGASVTGKVQKPVWKAGLNGELLGILKELTFDHSTYLWPWSGNLGVRVRVKESGKSFTGTAEGVVTVQVKSPGKPGDTELLELTARLPIRVSIVPTPPRRKRLLWDQYHNARYPPGYFPRDHLGVGSSPFDWNADHIHTNFRMLFRHLRRLGYFVEVLGEPWSCFEAENYGVLLVVDPEEEFWEEEQKKLKEDIEKKGLSLAVFADWYNVDVMIKLKFFDQNTQRQWTPVTGGSHLPALNDFLESFGMSFTNKVVKGKVNFGRSFDYSSGATVGAFPKNSHLWFVDSLIDEKEDFVNGRAGEKAGSVAIAGWLQIPQSEEGNAGRIFVIGDSSFVDSTNSIRPDDPSQNGFWIMDDVLSFLVGELRPEQVLPTSSRLQAEPYSIMDDANTPRRRHLASLLRFSRILHRKQNRDMFQCHVFDWVSSAQVHKIDWEKHKAHRLLLSREDPVEHPDLRVIQEVLQKGKKRRNMFRASGKLKYLLFGVAVLGVLLVIRHMYA